MTEDVWSTLVCNFTHDGRIVQAEVRLRQEANSGGVATVIPNMPLPGFVKGESYLESTAGVGSVVLQRTPVVVTKQTHSSEQSSLDVALNHTALTVASPPTDASLVRVRIFLTNFEAANRSSSRFTIRVGENQADIYPIGREGISHVAESPAIPYANVAAFKDFIDDVCWLCGFATGSRVDFSRVEVDREGQRIHLEYWSALKQRSYIGVTLSRLSAPGEIVAFIEYCLPRYRALREIYPMNNLVTMGIQAKATPYIENKALLMANFLEVIRYSYAQNIGVRDGILTERNDNFTWVAGQRYTGRASFADILRHFLDANDISGWEGDYTRVRNEIVHTGTVDGTVTVQLQRYLNLHHFCDRIVLALLEWDQVKGNYIPVNATQHSDPNVFGNNWIKFVR